MLQSDIERLKNILADFHNITGIMISLFDEDYRQIVSFPEEHTPFCALVRGCGLNDKCHECDRTAMLCCRRQKKMLIYECHMGMAEAVAPIMASEEVVGYLFIGQLLPAKGIRHIRDKINALSGRFDPFKEDLLRAAEEIVPLPEERLQSAARILELCTGYISLKRMGSSRRDPLRCRVEKYIAENIKDPGLSVGSICKACLISRSALYEICKRKYGVGVSDYIRARRVEMAKILLSESHGAISGVSDACGFTDASYFTKVFKRYTGITPKAYAAAAWKTQ